MFFLLFYLLSGNDLNTDSTVPGRQLKHENLKVVG